MGSVPALLSKWMLTWARPMAGRLGVPAKIKSSIFAERKWLDSRSPKIHRIASVIFDFPDPFGPTIATMPGGNSRLVFWANDLNPNSSRQRNCIVGSIVQNFKKFNNQLKKPLRRRAGLSRDAISFSFFFSSTVAVGPSDNF